MEDLGTRQPAHCEAAHSRNCYVPRVTPPQVTSNETRHGRCRNRTTPTPGDFQRQGARLFYVAAARNRRRKHGAFPCRNDIIRQVTPAIAIK